MEYCSGGDLNFFRHKQPRKQFSRNSARFYAAEVLVALEYLHMLGILFVAKSVRTRLSSIVGTHGYISPKMAKDKSHKTAFPTLTLSCELELHARELTTGLLDKDSTKRLEGKRRAADVKKHPFFKGLNLALAAAKTSSAFGPETLGQVLVKQSSIQLPPTKATNSFDVKIFLLCLNARHIPPLLHAYPYLIDHPKGAAFLEYLYMLGIIYKDLKLKNILVKSDNHIMLTEFDLSLCSDTISVIVESPKSSTDSSLFSSRAGDSQCLYLRNDLRSCTVRDSIPQDNNLKHYQYAISLFHPMLACELEIHTRELISGLLNKAPTKHLEVRRGAAEVKKNLFFKRSQFGLDSVICINGVKNLDHLLLLTLSTEFEDLHFSYIVMEYCSGGDLNSLRHKQPRKQFSLNSARFYAAEILVALKYLHMFGIIYRALKLKNMLDKSGEHIMLTEFNLSLCLDTIQIVVESPESSRGSSSFSFFFNRLLCSGLVKTLNAANQLFVVESVQLAFPTLMLSCELELHARELTTGLLDKDSTKHLEGKREAAEVKKHPFFKGLNLA
ncbi:hypothetical protein F8388_018875 [Cannabis sativa]|uniref:non-specific serine/threonine protein kinase n=1 Tax=Cannabis sativa TaxID=3483 RepID=A0A7J6FZP1_CANSA|nr:hypothetical protein F8388_018875 [Cannabis sativa]